MSGSDLIEIASLTTPTSPVYVGSGTNGASSASDMAIEGQFAYFSGNDPGVYACWIYPPETPTPYGMVFSHPYAGSDLWAHDGYLYKNTLGVGIRILTLY
jgi:hypothetical protein